MVRLLTDINFSGLVVRGLLRQRHAIDLVRAQDVGLDGVDDPGVLAWAADHDRILVSHDGATVPDFADARVTAGLPMPGVFHVNDKRMTVRQMIDELLLVDACSEHAEWAGRVVRLPLRWPG